MEESTSKERLEGLPGMGFHLSTVRWFKGLGSIHWPRVSLQLGALIDIVLVNNTIGHWAMNSWLIVSCFGGGVGVTPPDSPDMIALPSFVSSGCAASCATFVQGNGVAAGAGALIVAAEGIGVDSPAELMVFDASFQ